MRADPWKKRQDRYPARTKVQISLKDGKEMFKRGLFLNLILVAIPASADLLQVAVSGTFDNAAPVTSVSRPNVPWVLMFDVDSQPSVQESAPANFTVPVSNPAYILNTTAVAGVTTDQVTFFTSSGGGGLFVNFIDGDTEDSLNVAGSQLFSGATANPVLAPGTFDTLVSDNLQIVDASAGVDDNLMPDITSLVITDLSPVPEPRSNLLLGTMLAVTGTAFLFKRRRGPAAPDERSQD